MVQWQNNPWFYPLPVDLPPNNMTLLRTYWCASAENLTHGAVTQLLKILIAGGCIQGRRRPLFVQPTYETSHVVCNHPPAFTVRGSLSLLETVIAKMTFILTESSRLLHSDSWNEPRYWVMARCLITCFSIVLCNS